LLLNGIFIVVSVYFCTDLIRKLLDTPSYTKTGFRLSLCAHTVCRGKDTHFGCNYQRSFPNKVLPFQSFLTGPSVDVKEATERFTTDVIASCAFGIDSNSFTNPDAEFRYYLRKTFDVSVRKGLAALASFFAPYLKKVFHLRYLDEKTNEFFRKTVWSTVEYR
jgi:hypothetical protein